MDDDPHAAAGEPTTRPFSPPRLLINPAQLQRAAVVKTEDFRLLTAAFDGERTTFEPWLSLRLVERGKIVSWGVYQRSFPDDDPDSAPARPDVAWRRAEWDKHRDVERFRAAPDKGAYLLSDTQIDAKFRFARLAAQPRLSALVRESIELLVAGVRIVGVSRPDVAWENLRVSVLADELVMNLDYAPPFTRCGEVEAWAERFSTELDALEDDAVLAPDGDIEVSYSDSRAELADRVRRFPQPVVSSWPAGSP